MVSTELLRRYPLFAGQNAYMLGEIARLCEEVPIPSGEWVFHESEPANRFFLVLEGSIDLTLIVSPGGETQHITTTSAIEPGEILGWSAVVPPHQYKLGARAAKDSRLLAIDGPGLRQLLDDNPAFGYPFLQQIVAVVSERLLAIEIQLMSMVVDRQTT